MSLATRRSPHRAWIEVDHAALAANLGALRRLAGDQVSVIAVVKANAYGHGAIEVARTLLDHGAERLAVATLGEGLELRNAGIAAPTLVLWALGAPEVRSPMPKQTSQLRLKGLRQGPAGVRCSAA